MRLLIDTHSFLWFVQGDPRLGASARHLVTDAANDRFLSLVSVWEMAIKLSVGKLSLGQPIEAFIAQQLNQNGLSLLGIDISHVAAVAVLPLHHRDPFDRLLIAQAKVERMSMVSNDAVFDAYGVTRLW
jgi:PIN domain nuclease of toxin-antitoxin system